MTCKDVVARLPERVAGLLDAATAAQIDWHCSGCESCRAVAARETRDEYALRSAFATLGSLEAPELDVRGAVAASIATAPRPGRARWRRRAPGLVAAVLAVAVLPALLAAAPLTWQGLRAIAAGGGGMLGGLGALFEAAFGAGVAVLAAGWNLIEPVLRIEVLREALVGSATLLTGSGLALMTAWIAFVLHREIRHRPDLSDTRIAR